MNRTRKHRKGRLYKGGGDVNPEDAAKAAAMAENPALATVAVASDVAQEGVETAEKLEVIVEKIGTSLKEAVTEAEETIPQVAHKIKEFSNKAISEIKVVAKEAEHIAGTGINIVATGVEAGTLSGDELPELLDSTVWTPAGNLSENSKQLIDIISQECQVYDDTHINFARVAADKIAEYIPNTNSLQFANFLKFYKKSHPAISCIAEDNNWEEIYKIYDMYRNQQIDPYELTEILQDLSTESKMQLIFGTNLDPTYQSTPDEQAKKAEYGQLAEDIKTLVMNVLELLLEVNKSKTTTDSTKDTGTTDDSTKDKIRNELNEKYDSIKNTLDSQSTTG
jgi:hypothetical protein